MAATRKRAAAKEEPPAPQCDNHPHIQAVHTTGGVLHRPISLCEDCLRKVGSHLLAH